jgi:hypothetical protein
VLLKETDVSEVRTASIIRATRLFYTFLTASITRRNFNGVYATQYVSSCLSVPFLSYMTRNDDYDEDERLENGVLFKEIPNIRLDGISNNTL